MSELVMEAPQDAGVDRAPDMIYVISPDALTGADLYKDSPDGIVPSAAQFMLQACLAPATGSGEGLHTITMGKTGTSYNTGPGVSYDKDSDWNNR